MPKAKQKHNVYVGLDLSLTATGVVAVSNGTVDQQQLIKTKPPANSSYTTEVIRIKYIVEQIRTGILLAAPSLVAIEGMAFMVRNATALVQLSGLNYMVRSMLVDLDIPFIIVAPPSLKKFVTGSGKAQKDQMMLETYKRWNVTFMDNNLCDAHGLAQLASAAMGEKTIELNQEQREVVTLLEKQLSI